MIEIVDKSNCQLIIKYNTSKNWTAFIICSVIVIAINCQLFAIFTIHYSLICSKNRLNKTNCEITESSLLNYNLRHQEINNIGKPKGVLRDGTIWLGTKGNLFHNQIKNIYYPNYSFLDLSHIYLYRFHWQALQEINKITEYIRDRDTQATLKLTRNAPSLFYLSCLLLPLIIINIISIINLPPTQIYNFNLKQKKLIVKTKLNFAIQEDKYNFDNLKIEFSTTAENKQNLFISLYVGKQQLFTCDRFKNKQEASKIINQLQQHIKHSSFSSK